AAPTGPPLVRREPQFLKFRPGRSTSLRNGLACTALELVAPRFRCNPCAETAPQVRQRYCPNSDHAKFLSITQARESPRPHADRRLAAGGKTRRRAFAAAAPRSGPRSAGFRTEIRGLGRQARARNAPARPGGCGAYRSFRMKLFTGSL